MKTVYGPVPSRRLGASLGIDLTPLTCTFDCIYCQIKRKNIKTNNGKNLKIPKKEEILKELKESLNSYKKIDYITFSGSGEPTLNPELGEIINEIRKITDIKIALITNSSLLKYKKVIESAKKVDLILPSLDATDNETFYKINRPIKDFQINEIIDSIKNLKIEGIETWLEIFLLKGKISNSTSSHINGFIKAINIIKPDRVFLNTAIRPPLESYVQALEKEELKKISEEIKRNIPSKILVEDAYQTMDFKSKLEKFSKIEEEILKILYIRPCTKDELSKVLGIDFVELSKYTRKLIDENKIKKHIMKDKEYLIKIKEVKN